MSLPPCFKCRQPADHMQQVSAEAAMLHNTLYGTGYYLAPGEGYVLPICHDCNPWAGSNGHTWTYDGVCLVCGAPEVDDPPTPCPVDP